MKNRNPVGGNAEQVRVAVRHQLRWPFGRGVERDESTVAARSFDCHRTPSSRTRKSGAAPALCAQPSSTCRNPRDIRVGVIVRIFDRVAYAGLRRQVNHDFRLFALKQPLHAPPVGDIQVRELEIPVVRELREPRLLQPRIVIAVQIIDAQPPGGLPRATARAT